MYESAADITEYCLTAKFFIGRKKILQNND